MTPLTYWISRSSLIIWINQWRLIRWLWRWRWPGAPLTIVLALTIAQYIFPPDRYPWIDRGLIIGIVSAAVLLILVIIVGTQRPWGARPTGVLLLTVGDAALYGLLILPGTFGWTPPFAELSQYYLRANIAVAIPVLLLAWSDLVWEWVRAKWGVREEKE